jgi:hypothetical protein
VERVEELREVKHHGVVSDDDMRDITVLPPHLLLPTTSPAVHPLSSPEPPSCSALFGYPRYPRTSLAFLLVDGKGTKRTEFACAAVELLHDSTTVVDIKVRK